MLKQETIKPTRIIMSTKPDGSICLAISAGEKIHFDLDISGELWEKLADDARWFSGEPVPGELVPLPTCEVKIECAGCEHAFTHGIACALHGGAKVRAK